MISSDIFPVYAQYHEDIIIAAILGDTKKGFYVDVGANHEEYHSVTKYFYERGWRGINVEPIPRLIKEFKKKRPRDINLNYAVSSQRGTMEFREYPEHDGLSTFSEVSKRENEKLGLPYVDYDVTVDTLESIFSEHNIKQIDFMKIDVEGFEEEVLRSNDWKKYRPLAICIEANHRDDDWSNYLSQQKYQRVIFDGLNEYYVARESSDMFQGFAERAAVLAHSALRNHQYQLWRDDIRHISELRDLTKRQDELIRINQQAFDEKMSSLGFLSRQVAKQVLHRLRLRS